MSTDRRKRMGVSAGWFVNFKDLKHTHTQKRRVRVGIGRVTQTPKVYKGNPTPI